MAKKQTSEALSTLGARYMRMSNTRMRARFRKNRLQFFADVRRLAASVVSQDEVRGSRKKGKRRAPG